MRRSTQVLLVLMGGGMVSAAAVPLLRGSDCDPAVVQDGCSTGSSSSRSGWTTSTSYGGSNGSTSRSGGSDGASSTSVARGGFGSAGAAHASSGG